MASPIQLSAFAEDQPTPEPEEFDPEPPQDLFFGELEIVGPMGEGTADAQMVRAPNGELGVLKAAGHMIEDPERAERRIRVFGKAGVPIDGGPLREVIVYELNVLLGEPHIVPAAALVDSPLGPGVASVFVPAILNWRDSKSDPELEMIVDDLHVRMPDDKFARRMAQLDWVTGQADRHSKNLSFVVIDGEAQLVMIDNECCLGANPTPKYAGGIFRDLGPEQVMHMLTLDSEEFAAWRAVGSRGIKELFAVRGLPDDIIQKALARYSQMMTNQ